MYFVMKSLSPVISTLLTSYRRFFATETLWRCYSSSDKAFEGISLKITAQNASNDDQAHYLNRCGYAATSLLHVLDECGFSANISRVEATKTPYIRVSIPGKGVFGIHVLWSPAPEGELIDEEDRARRESSVGYPILYAFGLYRRVNILLAEPKLIQLMLEGKQVVSTAERFTFRRRGHLRNRNMVDQLVIAI
jgi:hypothetical protein